jgi:hypothetical protein
MWSNIGVLTMQVTIRQVITPLYMGFSRYLRIYGIMSTETAAGTRDQVGRSKGFQGERLSRTPAGPEKTYGRVDGLFSDSSFSSDHKTTTGAVALGDRRYS